MVKKEVLELKKRFTNDNHNFVSVGLYGTLWGNNLIYAYKDGIDYVINDNKELKLK